MRNPSAPAWRNQASNLKGELTVDTTLSRALRDFMSGPLNQLIVDLAGKRSEEVERELKKFNRRQPCWTKRNQRSRIFALNPAPFDPEFVGQNWSIWRGSLTSGHGLEGDEAHDKRSLDLTEVDVMKIRFENMLNEEDHETTVNVGEKILRLKMAKFIRLDARLCRDLLAEPNQTTLEWLSNERDVTRFDLPGTILRSPSSEPCVLYLYRSAIGWNFDAASLDRRTGLVRPSAVLIP